MRERDGDKRGREADKRKGKRTFLKKEERQ